MSRRHRAGRGNAVGSKSTRGGQRLKPSTHADRTALMRRCGARAFLDPAKLAYPIVAQGGECAPARSGARAEVTP